MALQRVAIVIQPAEADGSVVFIDSSLSYKRLYDFSFTNLNCESVWLEFNQMAFSLNGRNTIIAPMCRYLSSSIANFSRNFNSS